MMKKTEKISLHTPEIWNQAERYRSDNESLNDKNKQLEDEVHRLRAAGVTPIDITDSEDGSQKGKKSLRESKLFKVLIIWIPMACVVLGAIFLIGLYLGRKANWNEDPSKSIIGLRIRNQAFKSKRTFIGEYEKTAPLYNKQYMNIGERVDPNLRECQGPELKGSFPDLDYALMGYNVLKGYPLAVGHDPGFSLPVFSADYSDSHQTADCRYSVPRGAIVIPDVSCVVSFTSKVIQTRYEFSKSLSASAKVSGGGWGVSFSASAGYKMASSSISTGEYLYILSTASCRYYYFRIIPNTPPPLHPSFVDMVYQLDAASDQDEETLNKTYVHFFDTYGTHFAPEVTFGARYTHEHKMESKKLDKMSEKKVSVGVAASYSGLFNAGGGFHLDSDQRQAASEFQKEVETKTITVGAPPPATGDAQAWASSVKQDPVPVAFKLDSIENLFSDYFMKGLGVDYNRIAKNIKRLKGNYCQFMKANGEVDSCKELQPGLELKNTHLSKHYRFLDADKATCIEECNAEVKCVAISKCVSCKDQFSRQKCHLYQHKEEGVQASEIEGWESTIFLPKIHVRFLLQNTVIIGLKREGTESDAASGKRTLSQLDCWNACFEDEQCVAFTHCKTGCEDKTSNCRLYAQTGIKGMKEEMNTATYFISRLNPPNTTRPTTTATATPTVEQRHRG